MAAYPTRASSNVSSAFEGGESKYFFSMQQSSVVESVMNRFKFVRSEVTDLYIILWRDNGTAFLILSFPMKVHMLSV